MPVIAISVYAYYCPECHVVIARESFGEAHQAGIDHLKSHTTKKESEEVCEDTLQSVTEPNPTELSTQEPSVREGLGNTTSPIESSPT